MQIVTSVVPRQSMATIGSLTLGTTFARPVPDSRFRQTEPPPAEFQVRHDRFGNLTPQKQAGRPVQALKEEPRPSRVVSLMDALRKSIEAQTNVRPTRRRAGERRERPRKAG